jgi:hypothetical protein
MPTNFVAVKSEALFGQQRSQRSLRITQQPPGRIGQPRQLEFVFSLLLELVQLPLHCRRLNWVVADVSHALPAATPEAQLEVGALASPLGRHESLTAKCRQIVAG